MRHYAALNTVNDTVSAVCFTAADAIAAAAICQKNHWTLYGEIENPAQADEVLVAIAQLERGETVH